MKPGVRDLFWSLATAAAALGWLWLLVALSRLYEPLTAYALSVVPIVLFAGAVFLREAVWKRRRRKRLLDEEFRR